MARSEQIAREWQEKMAKRRMVRPRLHPLDVEFDLDPAHPPGPSAVPAYNTYSSEGLERPWFGFVWLNPPFGGRNALEPWLDKFFDHGQGIALTPDRTSAPWFRKAWGRAHRVLFLPKVRFLRPDGTPGVSPPNGTALWAAGDKASAALGRAARNGLGIAGRPFHIAELTGERVK